MNTDESDQLRVIADDVREIRQAVIGDSKIGLPGLVNEMKTVKRWQAQMDLRVAAISGGVAVLFTLGKAIIVWVFK